jgi:hypothetical protein
MAKMEERVDEKILEFINAAEEKENRKDIKNESVKIGNRYYEFEERDFYDERLKMYIPKDFEEMPLKARKHKYPSENRPDIIKCNESGSTCITLKIINSPLDEEHVAKLKEVMKAIIKKTNPANVFYEDGVLQAESKNIGFFEFKS